MLNFQLRRPQKYRFHDKTENSHTTFWDSIGNSTVD